MEDENERPGGLSGVLYWTIVVETELSWKAKLLIDQSIYNPTLHYGHELWAVTERMRSQIQVAKTSFHRRVAGLSPRGVARSSALWIFLWECPTGRRPSGKPRSQWGDYISHLAWEHLQIPQEGLESVQVMSAQCAANATWSWITER